LYNAYQCPVFGIEGPRLAGGFASPSARVRSSADPVSGRTHLSGRARPIDGDAELHQAVAGRIDVVDLIGEVAK